MARLKIAMAFVRMKVLLWRLRAGKTTFFLIPLWNVGLMWIILPYIHLLTPMLLNQQWIFSSALTLNSTKTLAPITLPYPALMNQTGQTFHHPIWNYPPWHAATPRPVSLDHRYHY